MRTEELKLSRLQENIMNLTTKEIEIIINALESCIEDVSENTFIGKTTSNKIERVLEKLKSKGEKI